VTALRKSNAELQGLVREREKMIGDLQHLAAHRPQIITTQRSDASMGQRRRTSGVVERFVMLSWWCRRLPDTVIGDVNLAG